MTVATGKLAAILKESAEKGGFPLVGVFDLAGFVDRVDSSFHACLNSYREWLRAGYLAEMTYLERGFERRADPRKLFSEAKSILCVALPYRAARKRSAADGPRFAEFLRIGDYHKVVRDKLESVLAEASSEWSRLGMPPLKWKICVDTSPVLEKCLAVAAGLGFVGKNTLLVTPRFGSYVVLGEAFLDVEVGQRASQAPDTDCGSCSICLDACPNHALVQSRVLDARRCISYRTIERKMAGTDDFRDVGTWAAGCDLCQECCPYNISAETASSGQPSGAFDMTWKEALKKSADDWDRLIKGTAVERLGGARMVQNVSRAFRNFTNGLAKASEPR